MPRRLNSAQSRFHKLKRNLSSLLLALCISGFTPAAWSKTKTPQNSTANSTPPKTSHSREKPPSLPSLHTAEELLDQLATTIRDADWQKAVMVYSACSRDFGDRPELLRSIASFRVPVALGLLQTDNLEAATPLIEAVLASSSGTTPAVKQELCFQRAACALRLNRISKAKEYFEIYASLVPPPILKTNNPALWFEKNRIQDALLLIAQCLLQEGKAYEAAARIAGVRTHFDTFHVAQAAALQFRALIEAEDNDAALRFLVENEAELQANAKLLSTQVCLAKLGAQLLESGRPRDALTCLQRVRRTRALATFQHKRLEQLCAQAKSEPPIAGQPRLHDSVLIETRQAIQSDLAAFEHDDAMDVSVRLRVSAAYAALTRPLEAALVLNETCRLWSSHPALSKAAATLAVYWSQAERWDNVLEAADAFHRQWPHAPDNPGVVLLKGVALQKLNRLEEAVATFRLVSARFPKTESAPRARLLEGFTLLMQGNADAAGHVFEGLLAAKTPADLSEEAAFGRCLGYALSSQHSKCRFAAGEYERKYPRGNRLPDVQFQNARAGHLSRDYKTAVSELRAFLAAFPENEKAGEAGVLLGDALLSEDLPLEALSAYQQVPSTGVSYERAWFKAAPLFARLNRAEGLRAHLLTFQSERPRSAQLADAVLWVMQASPPPPSEGISDKPFWELIEQHGDHWYVPAVDTLLTRLCTRREHPPGFSETLDQLLSSAETSGHTVLRIRILRAKARLEEARPEKSARLLKMAIDLAEPQTTSPSLLADFAEALLLQGEQERAIEQWRCLLKWHPRAAEKDRALAALASFAQANGDIESALAWIARFESETETSPLLGAVLLKKAALFSQAGNDEEEKRNLEALLQKSGISGEWKSEALLGLAEHHMRKGTPRLAIPYYQRIYVLYGRWTGTLARAYLRSGMAFEQLQDWEAARRTYQEMLDRDIPNQPDEVHQAQKRLQTLYDNGQ